MCQWHWQQSSKEEEEEEKKEKKTGSKETEVMPSFHGPCSHYFVINMQNFSKYCILTYCSLSKNSNILCVWFVSLEVAVKFPKILPA